MFQPTNFSTWKSRDFRRGLSERMLELHAPALRKSEHYAELLDNWISSQEPWNSEWTLKALLNNLHHEQFVSIHQAGFDRYLAGEFEKRVAELVANIETLVKPLTNLTPDLKAHLEKTRTNIYKQANPVLSSIISEINAGLRSQEFQAEQLNKNQYHHLSKLTPLEFNYQKRLHTYRFFYNQQLLKALVLAYVFNQLRRDVYVIMTLISKEQFKLVEEYSRDLWASAQNSTRSTQELSTAEVQNIFADAQLLVTGYVFKEFPEEKDGVFTSSSSISSSNITGANSTGVTNSSNHSGNTSSTGLSSGITSSSNTSLNTNSNSNSSSNSNTNSNTNSNYLPETTFWFKANHRLYQKDQGLVKANHQQNSGQGNHEQGNQQIIPSPLWYLVALNHHRFAKLWEEMRKNSSGSTNLSNTGSTSNLAQQDKVWQLEGIVDNELGKYLTEVIAFASLNKFKTIRLLGAVSKIVSNCQFTPYNIIPDSSWFQANYQQALANSSLQIIKDLVAKNQPKPVSAPATVTARTVTTIATPATAITTNAANQATQVQATQAQETRVNAIPTATNQVNQPASQQVTNQTTNQNNNQTNQQNTTTQAGVSSAPALKTIRRGKTRKSKGFVKAAEEIALTANNTTPSNLNNNNNYTSSSASSSRKKKDDDDNSNVGKLLIGAALFALFGIF